MRKDTAIKIANFRNDYANMILASYKFHNLKSGRYPCWSTLKKYGVVKYTRSEFFDAYVDENIILEIRYYEVTKE